MNTSNNLQSFQIIALRYIKLLESAKIIPLNDEYDSCSDHHLLWMLYQIYDNSLSSVTKCHRWLGFIQGVLAFKKRIDVQNERNITRNIFSGE